MFAFFYDKRKWFYIVDIRHCCVCMATMDISKVQTGYVIVHLLLF